MIILPGLLIPLMSSDSTPTPCATKYWKKSEISPNSGKRQDKLCACTSAWRRRASFHASHQISPCSLTLPPPPVFRFHVVNQSEFLLLSSHPRRFFADWNPIWSGTAPCPCCWILGFFAGSSSVSPEVVANYSCKYGNLLCTLGR